MSKECLKCNETKELDLFRKHSECKDGRANTCKDCFKKWTKAYEKTPKGFLMRLYRNMKSRITGVQKAKHHLYAGKTLLDKDTFYKWSKNDPMFWDLFKDWEDSGYERKLAPSVDRVDSNLGYELTNMEWVTMSENSRRASQWNKGVVNG